MKYIDSLREGMRISEVYLCKSKQIAQTKAGKDYGNLVLQDKTGTIDNGNTIISSNDFPLASVILKPWIMWQ